MRFSANDHHNKNLLTFRLFVVIASGITLLQIVLYVYFSGFAGGGGDGGGDGDNGTLNGVAIILLNSFFIQWFAFFVVIPLGYSLFIQPLEGNIGSFLVNYVVYADADAESDNDTADDDDEKDDDTAEDDAAAANHYFGSMHTITTFNATAIKRSKKALLKYLVGQFPVVFFTSMIAIITSLRGSTVYLI